MDILKRIAGSENITTEFKECRNKLPKNLFETICAFLNRMGRDIFLGVADDGTITGVEENCVPQLKKDISSLCNNANKIAPTVYLHTDECEVEGKTVLHIYVPESSQVHSTAGKIYDRNEDGDFDITGNSHLVAQMYIRKQREFTENTIYPYATLNDLETETIREVRIMAVNRQPNHPWEKLTDEELLKSCGLYKRDLQTGESGYTLACILLFGKDETILSAIPYFKTDAVYRKENLDRYDDRDEIKCNLIKSYGRLMDFIEKHLDDKFYMDGDRRIDVRNRLFREVVANLLIHREYSSAFPAKLIITADRVTTENGNNARSYGVIDLDDFSPYPKNPVIAGVFKEIGWAEELGSGVRNMKKYSQIYSGKLPEFEDGDIFRTTIFLNNGEENLKIGEATGEVTGEERLLEKEKKVYVLIKDNPQILRRDIIKQSGYSKNTVDGIIKSLKEKGYIKGRTSDRGGGWIL